MHTPTLRTDARVALSPVAVGLALVAFAALVMATTIALSRYALKGSLSTADLLAIRYGVGGVLFLPLLVRTWHTLPAFGRRAAVPLSFLHGWGMAGASLAGLAFAPASHAAALGPGCLPVFLALFGFLAYRKTLPVPQCIGLAAITTGAVALIAIAGSGSDALAVTAGDTLFLVAAMLGAVYFVLVEHHRIPAVACNAVVMVVSGLVVVPAYLAFANSDIPSAPLREIAIQVLFQGVLMSLAYLAVHKAVLLIGGARVTMIMAILPVLTLLAGRAIAGDGITPAETLAIATISGGILYGALWRLRRERAVG
ncbi:MAG: DMT family transporter [Burkholderiales bacterium]